MSERSRPRYSRVNLIGRNESPLRFEAIDTPQRKPDRRSGAEVVEHLRAYGHISSEPTLTPKEELLLLLRVAAEVEHALLVQYLYAATSVGRGAVADVIRDVAIQEMGHLITVENLLLAVGGKGEFHIGRDLARNHSQFNPIPFDLEPVSKLSLAEFILAERPNEIPQEYQSQLLELEQLVAGKEG